MSENNGFTLKKAKYAVDGSQSYDAALREWVAGKLSINVDYEIYQDDTKVGTANGTMRATFERIRPGE